MIQTKVSRRHAQRHNKTEGIALPGICSSFLIDESSLLPYLIWSNLFFILLFIYLFWNKRLFFPQEPDRTKQSIDIEFVSSTDFQNKDDVLPSTIPKPSLGRRVSPSEVRAQQVSPLHKSGLSGARAQQAPPLHKSRQSGLNKSRPYINLTHPGPTNLANPGSGRSKPRSYINLAPTPANPRQNKPQHREFTYTINCQQHASAHSFNWVTRTPANSGSANGNDSKDDSNDVHTASSPQKLSSSIMDLEEVAPLAMTEIKDNEGDDSLELWQDGGRSREGFGATSALANYLKELHKKLKRTWSPPPGPAHHIKVLFRLASEGNIVSLQLMSSSGDASADNSALEAVNKAAPFGKLPKDYPNPFLDLAYTFNYSTDELNEVGPSKQ